MTKTHISNCKRCGGLTEHYNGSECVACAMARRAKPEHKEQKKAYDKAYRLDPERQAKKRAQRSTPEHKMRAKAYRATSKVQAIHRRSRIKRAFHVSDESAELLLELSEGMCFICGRRPGERRLSVDHDHKSGIIRGVACVFCNRFLIKGGEAAMHLCPGLDMGVLSHYLRLELPIQAQLRGIEYTK